jgi:transcription antitermination protein NusB
VAGSRHKARVRAIEVLYEAEVREISVAQVIERRRAQTTPPINAFTETLAAEIDARRDRLDELIAAYAIGWTLERMPVVDRNILRMGAYEMLWSTDVPDGVAIAEAVAVARELSSDDAPGFINGLLSRMLEHKDSLTL